MTTISVVSTNLPVVKACPLLGSRSGTRMATSRCLGPASKLALLTIPHRLETPSSLLSMNRNAGYQTLDSRRCPRALVDMTLTQAEFERLRAECDRLRIEMTVLQETARQQRADLQIQFTRIAEMQAILDEERMTHAVPTRVRVPLNP